MPVRMLRRAALLAVLLLTFQVSGASAAPTVGLSSATASGGSVTVTGTAAFPQITQPQSVVGDNAIITQGAAGGSELGNMAGLRIVDAGISEINGGLRFTWFLQDIPDQGIPPEIVRYNWAFKIDGRLFQLQAKSTNVASVTTLEDPVGHAQQLQAQRPFFQLRGACVSNYLGTPSNGCYHLAFLNGNVNTTANTVSVDLPFNTKDSIGRLVAPEFVPGKTLVDNEGDSTAGMAIAASFQAVVSNTITSQYINGYDAWRIGGRVELGLGSFGQNPASVSYTTTATLDGGTFSETLANPAGANTVFARACNGTECAYASMLIE